jgi:hypothetical protein
MRIVAEPCAVDVSSNHQFAEEIGDASLEKGPFIPKMEMSVWTPGYASRSEVIACTSFFYNGGTVFKPWMKKVLELVDGYPGYLVAKLSALRLVTSPYYSKHVARKLGAGHSTLGALCNITLQRTCDRDLFSHVHSPLGSLYLARYVMQREILCTE